MTTFAGFPKQALTFFKALRKNNTREWFEVHKEDYLRYCKAPMEVLIADVNQALGKFAPEHIAEPKKAVYRIYRDTRFSNNKTPYKTHIAANFPRKGMEKHAAAGFYFSVSDEEIEIAGGVYMPGPVELAAIRNHIVANHEELQKIAANRKTIQLIGELKGDALKRLPRGFPEDTPAASYVRMKQWMFFQSYDAKIATTPEFLPFLVERLKAVGPLVTFLNAPLLHLPKERAAERMFER